MNVTTFCWYPADTEAWRVYRDSHYTIFTFGGVVNGWAFYFDIAWKCGMAPQPLIVALQAEGWKMQT